MLITVFKIPWKIWETVASNLPFVYYDVVPKNSTKIMCDRIKFCSVIEISLVWSKFIIKDKYGIDNNSLIVDTNARFSSSIIDAFNVDKLKENWGAVTISVPTSWKIAFTTSLNHHKRKGW